MKTTDITFAVLLAITCTFCFALAGASIAMIGLAHVSAKLGIAIAVFSLLTGYLTVDAIVDLIFGGN